jgi:hypothetical protein
MNHVLVKLVIKKRDLSCHMNVLVHPSSSNFAAGRRATLLLKNQIAFQGYSFGHEAEASGECVFQTGEFLQNL